MKTIKSYILKSFILGIFFLGYIPISSQTTKKIFGHVYENETGNLLIGATLLLSPSNFSTSTDEFGLFQFSNIVEDKYDITASYLGFKSKTIFNVDVRKDIGVELNIYLEKEPIKLDEVMVSSLSSKDFEKNGIIKFNREDFKQKNYQTVGEILLQTSGIDITETGSIGSAQKISINGSENNQVLVLLDGVPLNDQFGGVADLSKIPTNIIESIEVHKGGNSSLFGSGAIGGVINIISRKSFDNKLKLRLTGGSFGLFKAEPSFSGNLDNLNYLVSYNFTKSNGNYPYSYKNTSGNNDNSNRINSDFLSQNIFTQLNYKLRNHIFSFSITKSFFERGLPGMTNALTAYARSSNDNLSINAGLKSSFENFVMDINYSFANSSTENKNIYGNDTPVKYSRYPQYHYKYKTKTSVLNSTINFKPLHWLYIRAGYNGKFLNYSDVNLLSNTDKNSTFAQDFSNGIYLQQEFRTNLSKSSVRIIVTPTIRYDNIIMTNDDLVRNENQWSPSLSAYFSLGEKNLFYIRPSISKSFRAPTFSDLFYQDVRVEGKPDLLPEQSFNRDIKFGLDLNLFGKLKTEFTYFINTVDNMIIWKLGSFEIFRPFNNDAEITGQTYSLQYQSNNRNVFFDISYSHTLPLDKNQQETTRNKIIPYHAQHSLKLNFNLNINDFITQINYRLIGKRYVTVANTVELNPYNILDLSLRHKINIVDIQAILNFTINNLTNEQYELVRNYPLPGREYRLGLSLTY